MEMKKTEFSYLEPLYMDSRVFEQTQELRLGEGMPDAEKVLGVWGQPVLRGKDWRTDTVGFSAGMLLWALYQPEDGSAPRMLEGWVPIQGKWTLPEDTGEGTMLLDLTAASLDGRIISPRKILVRCGLGACLQALEPKQGFQYTAEGLPEDVYVLERKIPLLLYMAAGEKAFQMEEDLGEKRILCFTVKTNLTDQKVVGNKLALRGTAEVQALLEGMESKTFVFPFSQVCELDETFGSNAQAEVTMAVTAAELEGSQLKLGLTAQYAIADQMELSTVEDAYSNRRPLELTVEDTFLPAILDRRWETLPCQGTLPEPIPGAVQMTAWMEPAALQRREEGTALAARATVQVLTMGEDRLQERHGPLAGERLLPWEGDRTVTCCQPGTPQPSTAAPEGISCECRCRVVTFRSDGIPQVTAMELGEPTAPDPNRPSLILCRAEKKSLWAIAKETGSSVEAIQIANHLEADPALGQMLLIPVG